MCRSCWPRVRWRSDATGGRVKLRSVCVAQDGQGWRGGQDRCGAGGAAKRRAISLSGEGQQAVCQHQMCPAVPKDEGSVRKVGEVACLPDLCPVARHAGRGAERDRFRAHARSCLSLRPRRPGRHRTPRGDTLRRACGLPQAQPPRRERTAPCRRRGDMGTRRRPLKEGNATDPRLVPPPRRPEALQVVMEESRGSP